MERSAQRWVTVGRGALTVGDRVSAEAGGLPIYRVVQVRDERVWLREERTGRDCLMSAAGLRWRLEGEEGAP